MKNSYICPKCKGHLKVNKKIIFVAKTDKGDSGLLLLDPNIGEYDVLSHESFKYNEGEHLDIFCPLCHENLVASDLNDNLAKVIMIDENGNKYDIYFSEIYGEKSTYKVEGENIEAYGDDSDTYMNFFGATPTY